MPTAFLTLPISPLPAAPKKTERRRRRKSFFFHFVPFLPSPSISPCCSFFSPPLFLLPLLFFSFSLVKAFLGVLINSPHAFFSFHLHLSLSLLPLPSYAAAAILLSLPLLFPSLSLRGHKTLMTKLMAKVLATYFFLSLSWAKARTRWGKGKKGKTLRRDKRGGGRRGGEFSFFLYIKLSRRPLSSSSFSFCHCPPLNLVAPSSVPPFPR